MNVVDNLNSILIVALDEITIYMLEVANDKAQWRHFWITSDAVNGYLLCLAGDGQAVT
jgi:hypothetical protein